ncbi:hypothetical protein HDV00_009493 [Rhizophlyctis rosea]|nr:hypothetical protein HDV00_009493 [Rhizophlyctis rosea]
MLDSSFIQYYSTNRKTFVQRKSVSIAVNWYIYSADHNILATSTSGTSLQLFYLKHGFNCNQLPVWKLESKKESNSVASVVTRKQVSILSLYDRIYGAVLDVTGKVAKLSLYRITKSNVRLELELELGSLGLHAVNVCDDLLLVHNISSKTTAIFDILHDYTGNSILPPEAAAVMRGDAYDPDWQARLPHYVLSPTAGILYDVFVDLEALCSDMRPTVDDMALLNFLLRRSSPEAGLLALQLIKEMLEKETDLRVMKRVFRLISAKGVEGSEKGLGGRGMTRDSSFGSIASRMTAGGSGCGGSPGGSVSSRSGRQSPLLAALRQETSATSIKEAFNQAASSYGSTVTQEEMYTHVLQPLASDKILATSYIATAVLEYITASHTSSSSSSFPYLHELLASLLIQSKRYVDLQQHMQHRVVQDSLPLAKMLLKEEQAYRPFGGLGLEMLKRVGTVEDVIDALLARGKVLEALRHALLNNAIRDCLATSFLDAAYASGDKMLFFNVFRCLEEHGMVPSGDHGHHDGSRAGGGAGRARERLLSQVRLMSSNELSGDRKTLVSGAVKMTSSRGAGGGIIGRK